ncbi:MAG TPA: DUF6365 family protein [Mobilitalea sp.]|nr:DUF6365 family protein [Mobilitalea sp.]
MRFLFIVTSFWAYGELQIAVDFARQVMALGHQVLFLIPPSHVGKLKAGNMPYQILIPNGTLLNRILFKDIENTYQPTHIVLSDILNFSFCERHYGLTEADLEIFAGFIGGFDLYDFANAGKSIDTYGFRAKEMTRINIESYDFLLMPCPVNQVVKKAYGIRFPYRIFDGIKVRTPDEIAKAKINIGLEHDKKLIIITGSTWQSSFRPYRNVKEMVDAVDEAVMRAIGMLPEHYQVLWIGPRHRPLPKDLSQIKQIKSLPPLQFEQFMSAADVFLSANYISTSMVRAALMGCPVVLLGNSYIKKSGKFRSLAGLPKPEPDLLNDMDRIYPFRMFPVGWYSFLEPVVKGNHFYKLTRCVEVFNFEEVYKNIIDAAAESYEESIGKLNSYKDKWLELPSVESIMLSLKNIDKKFNGRG